MSGDCASITSVRAEVRARLTVRDVVVLAIDGVTFDVGAECWPRATLTRMQSVFPTTSSSAWLSSVTGADVATHGVPGVVFNVGDATIDVFRYAGPLGVPRTGSIFSDARDAGYAAISIVGDCEPFDCSWREALLRDSQPVFGHRFYTAPGSWSPDVMADAVARAVDRSEPAGPRLIWCYVDLDRSIHERGYDGDARRFLRLIDELASEIAASGATVIAYSDHGLTPTKHEPEIARALERIPNELGCATGGAGRTRWIYTHAGNEERIVSALEQSLPRTIRICPADEVFCTSSLARSRVGDVVVIAEGEEFVTFGSATFEHGSLTGAELFVPFAEWGVNG